MKKLSLFFAALLFISYLPTEAFAQNRSITFEETTWAAILAKAKSENKPIFLDAFASWCSPCKYLAAKVFTADSVADFYNKNFVNAHFDMEKGEGIEIKAKYGVQVYPTLIYINGNGEVMHQAAGARPPAEFIQLGMDALNPEKQLMTFRKKYENGNKDPKFVMTYLQMLKDSYSNYDAVVSDFLKNQDEKDLVKKANWEIIKEYCDNVNSREIKFVIKNKNEFAKEYTENAVDEKIKSAFSKEFDKVIKSRNFSKQALDSLKNVTSKSGYDKAEEVILAADFSLYKRKKDVDNFIKTADNYLKLKSTSSYNLNEAAWFVFENSADKEKLEKAAAWAKKGMEMSQESGIYDTYANILFKLGNKAEAVKYEEKALELAKKAGEDTAEIVKTIEEMKK